MIATTLAHYRITAALGAGGMGEVWRATDEKLGREVALKILPADFASDPERLARFEREAKVLASLNHPNIAHLYGLETVESESGTGSDGATFLVMELVEGEDLSERIKRGPIPIDEVISIARQIAEALEAAHEAGIVHRDLKPANIKITEDGTVKVLDFGLATAWESEGSDSSLSMSPTLTRHATMEGVILGTAAYMSPEQARGKKVDRRADIWAFGVVLWEMLTGRRLFEGETVSDILAAVLRAEIPLTDLPDATPPGVRRVLRRCLARDPKHRLRDIGDAGLELGQTEEPDLPSGDPQTSPVRPGAIWVASIAGLIVGGLATWTFLSGWLPSGDGVSRERIASYLAAPEGYSFDLNSGPPAISRDGRSVAFLASRGEEPCSIFVRSLDSLEARRLEDTTGALTPFWSPDGGHLGFFADGKLKRIDIDGGRAETLAEAPESIGGFWAENDTVIFVGHYNSPPRLVDAGGGDVRRLPDLFENLLDPWYSWPQLLPGGRSYIVALQDLGGTRSGVYAASVDGRDPPRRLSRTITRAQYIAPDHLLFSEGGVLKSFVFDPATLEIGSEGVRVADVGWSNYLMCGRLAVSPGGLLVYQPGTGENGDTELVVVDRMGRELSVVGSLAEYYSPMLSHNGRQIAVDITDVQVTQGDVWVFDIERGTRTRLAGTELDESSPVWSPDDGELYYRRVPDLFVRDVAGAKPARPVIESGVSKKPEDVSPDGRLLIFEVDSGDDADLWVLDLETGEATPWLDAPYREHQGRFSPDGRWVAYESEESGVRQVYLRSFPDGDRRLVVSTEGGGAPVWRADGGELFYYSADSEIVAVPVTWTENGPRLGASEPLFRVRLREADSAFDVYPDGKRFLLNRVVAEKDVVSLVLVQNAFKPEESR